MENISIHIGYNEATKSQTAERLGIVNIPSLNQLANMVYVANELFEPLRNWWGKPIGISSFFRCLQLNKIIGGSAASQHCLGLAIDIDADIYDNSLTNKMIFDFFYDKKNDFKYDQLIFEFGTEENPSWVHISKIPNGKNRIETLRALKKNGKTIYEVI